MEKLPAYLTRYFTQNSYIILYPAQADNYSNDDIKTLEDNARIIGRAGEYVRKIFSGKEPRKKR